MRAVILYEKELPLLRFLLSKFPELENYVLVSARTNSRFPSMVYLVEPGLEKVINRVQRIKRRPEVAIFVADYCYRIGNMRTFYDIYGSKLPRVREVLFSRAARDILVTYQYRKIISQAINELLKELHVFSWENLVNKGVAVVGTESDDLALCGKIVWLEDGLVAAVPGYFHALISQENDPGKVLFLLLFCRKLLETLYSIMLYERLALSYLIIKTKWSKFMKKEELRGAMGIYIAAKEILPDIQLTSEAKDRLLQLSEKLPKALAKYVLATCKKAEIIS